MLRRADRRGIRRTGGRPYAQVDAAPKVLATVLATILDRVCHRAVMRATFRDSTPAGRSFRRAVRRNILRDPAANATRGQEALYRYCFDIKVAVHDKGQSQHN